MSSRRGTREPLSTSVHWDIDLIQRNGLEKILISIACISVGSYQKHGHRISVVFTVRRLIFEACLFQHCRAKQFSVAAVPGSNTKRHEDHGDTAFTYRNVKFAQAYSTIVCWTNTFLPRSININGIDSILLTLLACMCFASNASASCGAPLMHTDAHTCMIGTVIFQTPGPELTDQIHREMSRQCAHKRKFAGMKWSKHLLRLDVIVL